MGQALTVYEAGSIYTIQGFDLNYVGVILGPSILLMSKVIN
ncbi:DNA/RNA helicase domain-containing protein [Alkalihalobacillus deserti]